MKRLKNCLRGRHWLDRRKALVYEPPLKSKQRAEALRPNRHGTAFIQGQLSQAPGVTAGEYR
jgi:hypothetical protein